MRDINLLPSLQQHKMTLEARNRLVIVIFPILMIMILAIAAYTYLNIQMESYNLRKTELEVQIQKFSTVNATKKLIQDKQMTLTVMQEIIDATETNLTPSTWLLDTINTCMSEDMFALNMTHSDSGQIAINGRSKSKESIAYFIYQLKNSSRFSDVYVANITKTENKDHENYSDYTFMLSLTIAK